MAIQDIVSNVVGGLVQNQLNKVGFKPKQQSVGENDNADRFVQNSLNDDLSYSEDLLPPQTTSTPADSSTSEPTSPTAGYITHRVQKGDTVFGLLVKQGFTPQEIKDYALEDVRAKNKLNSSCTIQLGKDIQLPVRIDIGKVGEVTIRPDDEKSPQQPTPKKKKTAPTGKTPQNKSKRKPGSVSPRQPVSKTPSNPNGGGVEFARRKVYQYLAANGGFADTYNIVGKVNPKDPGEVLVTATTRNSPGIVGGYRCTFSVANNQVRLLSRGIAQ